MNREEIRSLVVEAIADSNTLTSVVDKLYANTEKIEVIKESLPKEQDCKTVVEAFAVQEISKLTQ